MFQRKWGIHRDADYPGGEQFAELCQSRPVGCHVHLPDFDAALRARRVRGDRGEPAAVRDRSERAGGAARDGVCGQIDAAAASKLTDLTGPIR